MSIRNLGSWDPLGLDSDPVHADPDAVSDAQTHYQNIAQTIDDAVSKLQQIVDTNSESLAGQYVQALQKNAQTILSDLTKVGARYTDVANQIQIYQPALGEALSDTATALTQAEAAVQAQNAAQVLPNPQPSSGQTLTADQQTQVTARTNAVNSADDDLSAAKSRLSNAMDALNVAGKRFGDAVSANNYHDGLTDTWKDKVDAFFAEVSKVFSAIGMALAALGLLIPGVDAIVAAGFVAGVVSLIANSVLLANGAGSVLDVVMGAVGLGLAGFGAGLSQVLKGAASAARAAAEAADATAVGNVAPVLNIADETFGGAFNEGGAVELDVLGADGTAVPAAADGGLPGNVSAVNNFLVPRNAATDWEHLSDWYNNPATNAVFGKFGGATPDTGFFPSAAQQWTAGLNMWKSIGSNPGAFASEFAGTFGGYSGFRGFAGVMGAVGGSVSPWYYVFGGVGFIFGLGGIGYTGGRLAGQIPAVN